MLFPMSPYLAFPLAIIFALCATFLLALVKPLWHRDPGQREDHVALCRVASVCTGLVGTILALLAIAYAHAALYGWGVL